MQKKPYKSGKDLPSKKCAIIEICKNYPKTYNKS